MWPQRKPNNQIFIFFLNLNQMFSWKYIGNTEVKKLILKWLLVYYNSITTPQTYHLKLIHTRIRVSERQQLSNKTINMAVFYTGYTTNTHMQNKWSVLHGKITFFCFFFTDLSQVLIFFRPPLQGTESFDILMFVSKEMPNNAVTSCICTHCSSQRPDIWVHLSFVMWQHCLVTRTISTIKWL